MAEVHSYFLHLTMHQKWHEAWPSPLPSKFSPKPIDHAYQTTSVMLSDHTRPIMYSCQTTKPPFDVS